MGRNGATEKTKLSSAKKPSATSPPAAFAESFLTGLLPDDPSALPPEAQKGLVSSFWRFAQVRPRGAISLRLVNPSREKDGWMSHRTVLEIIADDMPFLVDSVTGELHRRGYAIHLSLHPVLRVRRDDKGRLIDLKGEKADAESFMHLQFDLCLDPQQLDDIAKELHFILDNVKAAVEDKEKMFARMAEAAAGIKAPKGSRVTLEDVTETKSFLEWLGRKNFTLLGYRYLDIVRKDKRLQWKAQESSGLGILRRYEARVFGDLRDRPTLPPDVQRHVQQRHLIIIVKANERSRVHRAVPMDTIVVQRFDDEGRIAGEHLFAGLFTSTAYTQSVRYVPLLRHKVMQVINRARFDPAGHNGRALLNILDTYPRDELFQIDPDELFENSLAILKLQERAGIGLFVRKDIFNRFVTCLLFVPRERYDSELRIRIQQLLENAFAGCTSELNVRIDSSRLARVIFTITTGPASRQPDREQLESSIRELCRTWQDRLHDSLLRHYDEARSLQIMRLYGAAFPPGYCDVTSAAAATRDIHALERVKESERLVVDLFATKNDDLFHLKLFQPGFPLLLSDVLPLIENMGLRARYMSGPHEVAPGNSGLKVFIHEFVCRPARPSPVDFATLKPSFEEAFAKVCSKDVENDLFNGLTLYAGLEWREIVILRAMGRYLRQLRIPYDLDMMASTLLAHPKTAYYLARLFVTNNDPGIGEDRARLAARLRQKIHAALADVKALEEDRILRRYLNLIESVLRTNYFQPAKDGGPKSYLSIKYDSRKIEFMPLPKPLVEVFVYSPRVEAIHLRGGKVARGGIRWSDRRDDFRNEILGLMKAQMVKNIVIVPVGSKGGFIVKRPPEDSGDLRTEGVACYRILIRGLLDITDNRINGRIVPPERVVRHDGDDPYLVVAADKGTAKFSDIANEVSQEYGFWLDDAFASGGSAGYDHKEMGITARGAWEAVKRHFRELGKDIQTTDFTCVGVGDMSGDVFGNGMLLSKHIRLLGAFDHRHIFCDPDPDAATSFAERERLFKLPRSSWADYDPKKISKGGAVFARTEKTVKLTPEIKKAFGIAADTIPPSDLIQVLLRAKVDLLYFGDIGTYVKASDETHDTVGDRANNLLRVDGGELQAHVVCEGANLGMTQRGRIEYALKGGRLNTDAIDNSAGVDCSDHEVNIKILLRKIVTGGDLSLTARNKMLASMTDDVAGLVLKDNYRQTQALSIAESQASELLPLHAQSIRLLEKSGLLNRAVEFLPGETDIAERRRLGKGLTRPELSVLMAYAKIWLYEQLMASDLPDDPFLHKDLLYYFPELLREKYPDAIGKHQLRREIVATRLANSIVNRVGGHFVFTVSERTGKDVVGIARVYLLVRAAYDLHNLWKDIESLDNRVPAATQIAMHLAVNRMMEFVVPWFLTEDEIPAKLSPYIERYREAVERLTAWLDKAPPEMGLNHRKTEKDLIDRGVPKSLAFRMAVMPYLSVAPELAKLAAKSGCAIEQAAAVFFKLGDRMGLNMIRERAESMAGPDTPHQRDAVNLLLDDLLAIQRLLTAKVIGLAPAKQGKTAQAADLLSLWYTKEAARLESCDARIEEIRAAGALDLAILTLAIRQLGALVK